MKKIFYLTLMLSISTFAQQRKHTLISNNITGVFEIVNKGTSIFEKIKILNSSNDDIFLPEMENKELFYFILGSDSHSYVGAMNSKLGPPNLGGNLKLIKLRPNESYEFQIELENSIEISNYYYGFDFIKNYKKFIFSENNKFWIKTINYVNNNQSILSKIE